MHCPRCKQDHSEDMIETPRTERHAKFDVREHRCRECGCRWTSVANIQDVFVYNPVTMKEETVSLEDYNKLYRDVHLGKLKHPAEIQKGMFDEYV